MEGLKILIRNLAFILLLATFLEMLLPNKSMKGFVQLVMGLFVIAAILSPLTEFLKLDFTDEVPAWVVASSADMPVLAGERIEDMGKSAVREQYKRILINQIEIFVSAVEGVEEADVTVELEKDAGGFADYPQILKIEILFNQSKSGVKPIETIIIGENSDEPEDNQETPLAMEIQRLVSAFMQIPQELVVVRERM